MLGCCFWKANVIKRCVVYVDHPLGFCLVFCIVFIATTLLTALPPPSSALKQNPFTGAETGLRRHPSCAHRSVMAVWGCWPGGDELCAEFPPQLCDRIPKPKAILKSDNATAPTERSSPPGFKLLQMFGESGHEADRPLLPTSQTRASKSVSRVSVTSWKLTEWFGNDL